MSAESTYASALESKLKGYTLSPAAAHWVAKCLHPVAGGPSQIPDAIQVDTVVPEYKNTMVITAPANLATNANWDCYILLPPSDMQAALIATGSAGVNFATASYNPGGPNGILSTTVIATTTSSPNAPFNTFSVTGAVSGTPALGARNPYQTVSSSELPAAWRTTARSATIYATGSDLYNQGTIYAGQYARPVRPGSLGGSQDITGGGWSAFWAYNVDYVDLPLDESTMALLTPSMYTASARDGVYTVHRMTGPAQDFTRSRSVGPFIDVGGTEWNTPAYGTLADDGSGVHQFRIAFGPDTNVSPLFAGTPNTPNAQQQGGSTGFDDRCTWGVVIARGLHPLMTLTIKTVVNLELIPTDASPNRQFVRPPLKYEPTAMAAYYAIASEAPNCMAAKHNFLGTLLPILASVASRVLPFLAPIAGTALSALGSRLMPPRGEQAPATVAPRRPALRESSRARSVSRASRVSMGSRASQRKVKIQKRKRKR